jgi:hypothetical protein
MAVRVANLVVAGVPKGGTTSLFEYLSHHPEVRPARVKETRFFTSDEAAQPDARARYATYFEGCQDGRYILEASPGYFAKPDVVLARMRTIMDLEDVRVLVSLREPVSRMRSHHGMAYREQRVADVPQRF